MNRIIFKFEFSTQVFRIEIGAQWSILTLILIASFAGIDDDFPTVGMSGELDRTNRYIISIPVLRSK